jgi:hypothetical protein
MTHVAQRLACAGAIIVAGVGLPAVGVARAADSAGPVQGVLLGVSALSPASAWTVGYRCLPDCASMTQKAVTLIRHWNGRTWSMVASPNPGADWDYLQSVSADSAADAWAVGEASLRLDPNTEISGTLIEHWNGRTWVTVPSPSPGISDNALFGVSAISATSAWAVGDYQGGTGIHQALILHWNGKAWARVSAPALGRSGGTLLAVRAVSAASAWAVGEYVNAASMEVTLILHWNGKTWTKVPSPSPVNALSGLAGISVVSAGSAWATGASCLSACGEAGEVDRTLILHWNGKAWTTAARPARGQLTAVSAATATSAWAAGSYCVSACGLDGEVDHTLIEHWNGKTWTTAASRAGGQLSAVSAASATSAWAVGFSGSRPLILHWNGRTWSSQ